VTRVLVVDDSAVARRLLGGILSAHGGFEVVGEATNGEEAVALAARLYPDVVTMDIRMPVMDGYEATRQIMAATPTPIVMVSAHEAGEVERSFNALAAGAVTVMPKPVGPGAPEHGRQAAELTRTLQAMAGLRLVTRRHAAPARPAAPAPERRARARGEVVAIGASTGGPAALGQILRALPADFPAPILVVQHIAEGFDEGLANWLNTIAGLTVRLAGDGDPLRGGEVLIAPNGAHLGVTLGRRVELSGAPAIGAHRPAATHMFASVARAYGGRAVGVILTGIGRDGTDGLAALKAAGGRVIGQDEASSVVYGMPRAAAEAGLVDEVLPAADIAGAMRRLCVR
jgi:two-component system chemotaxis response regulator CheB